MKFYVWRHLLRHPVRTIVTLAAVVVGVGTVVAVTMISGTAERAHATMLEAVSGSAHLQVLRAGESGVNDELTQQVLNVRGVVSARAAIHREATLVGDVERTPILAVAFSKEMHDQEIVVAAGHHIQVPGELLVDGGLVRTRSLRVGDIVQLLTPGGPREFRIAGILGASGLGRPIGNDLAPI